MPSSIALVGRAVSSEHIGAGMGVFGSLRKLGKIAGPVAVGGMLEIGTYSAVFDGLAALMVLGAFLLMFHMQVTELIERRVRNSR